MNLSRHLGTYLTNFYRFVNRCYMTVHEVNNILPTLFYLFENLLIRYALKRYKKKSNIYLFL